METVLRTQGLCKHYRRFQALDGLDMEVPKGAIYSLVETAGANGLSERGYLHIVLSNLPSMDFRQHPELLKDLMPWSDYMRSCFEQE